MRTLRPDSSPFEPLPQPKPDEWLANHPEPGQSFDEFIASRPNKPSGQRRTIEFQPLDRFDDDSPRSR